MAGWREASRRMVSAKKEAGHCFVSQRAPGATAQKGPSPAGSSCDAAASNRQVRYGCAVDVDRAAIQNLKGTSTAVFSQDNASAARYFDIFDISALTDEPRSAGRDLASVDAPLFIDKQMSGTLQVFQFPVRDESRLINTAIFHTD